MLQIVLCVVFALICSAEYQNSLLDKIFQSKTRRVQKFKTNSWRHMAAANLTGNTTQPKYYAQVDRFLQTRLTFRDDLCAVYDRASECHTTGHNHSLQVSVQHLARIGKEWCMLGLSAAENYTHVLNLRRCLPQVNMTTDCRALQSCMEEVVKPRNDSDISRELVAYDQTNDIGLVDSIVRPVTGALIAVPVSAFITTMICFEFVLGMTGAIEAGVMTGAFVAFLLGALTLAVWEILRRIPWLQHRLHPTLQGVSNTSLLHR